MLFIQRLIDKYREKKERRDARCGELLALFSDAIAELNKQIYSDSDYVDESFAKEWRTKYSDVLHTAESLKTEKLSKAEKYPQLLTTGNSLLSVNLRLPYLIDSHNAEVTKKRIADARKLLGEVEGHLPDDSQLECMIKEAHNHLVIAGAGTGKTTTIVGKVKYLLLSGAASAKDILVLSFTNASASEMSERIKKETGTDIDAFTFHKLGMNIIGEAEGTVPKVSKTNIEKFVKEQLMTRMKDTEYLRKMNVFLTYNRASSRSEFDFGSWEEYNEYLSLNPPTTLFGEVVKSYGEMDIANFLYQNRIEYVYEAPYEHDTNNSLYGQYCPDYFLPKYGIYIEYFGINQNGEVPAYFDGKNGRTASETYSEGIRWKRELHKSYGTVMVECYAYEKARGSLIPNLERNLSLCGVDFDPMSPEEVWQKISEESSEVLNGAAQLFGTAVNLIKSGGHTFPELRQMAASSKCPTADLLALELLEPIYADYGRLLEKNGEIDFNDMIKRAAEYVRNGKYHSHYRHVIVDEYQDISKARFSLLSEIRKSQDYDLFCVGDDWQSIYRFAGSDVNFILNFEKYWGSTEISKIETTYRFTDSLIDISGRFIMKNPMQIRKSLRGTHGTGRFALGKICGYTEKNAVQFMTERLSDLPQNASVFFIGRYSFDVNLLRDSDLYDVAYNNETGIVNVVYAKRPDLKMRFLTAHKSKGLQADYVFIINNKRSRMGFPSKIQDAHIISLLLEGSEDYPYSEERRLFYVALTRAKQKVFLLTLKDHESAFAKELEACYKEELKREPYECPVCGGRLVRRKGKYGDFFGCSNYRGNGCMYTRKIHSAESESQ